jgi:hypothetical protein
MTAVRESFTGVHSATPAEQVMRRSRRVRAWRRIPGVAAALVVVAGAAVAVSTLIPPGHQPRTELAAWTVARQADGTVTVTVRELRDPAGLQQTLRADGIPATVTFSGQMPAACQRYPVGTGIAAGVFTVQPTSADYASLIIHPAALPPGAGVAINPPAQQPIQKVIIGLVHAIPECTGG